jgi:hypothetical protein
VKKAKANMEICKYAVSDLIVSREFSAANGNDRCFSSGKKRGERAGWMEGRQSFFFGFASAAEVEGEREMFSSTSVFKSD